MRRNGREGDISLSMGRKRASPKVERATRAQFLLPCLELAFTSVWSAMREARGGR